MSQSEWREFYNFLIQLDETQMAAFIEALKEMQTPSKSQQPVSACL